MLLLLLWPLMLVVAIAIRVNSPGPAFFRQLRPGRGGREFRIFKFRTMAVRGEQAGPATTSADDARVTSVGRYLRRWKLDELPQLINVLRGEMSFVGPRPLPTRLWRRQFGSPEAIAVLSVRPGITSLATIRFRNEEGLLAGVEGEDLEDFYSAKILPLKMAINVEYLPIASLSGDAKVILRTLDRVVRSHHEEDRHMEHLLEPRRAPAPPFSAGEPEPVQVEDQGD